MAGIDESLTFYPLHIAVLTVSDTRTAETDKSGSLLVERLIAAGHELAGKAIVADDVEEIQTQVRAWVEADAVDLIITTGGTGFAPRDVTPEAVRPLFRRAMGGFWLRAPWGRRRVSNSIKPVRAAVRSVLEA